MNRLRIIWVAPYVVLSLVVFTIVGALAYFFGEELHDADPNDKLW